MYFEEWLHEQHRSVKEYFKLEDEVSNKITHEMMMEVTKNMPMKPTFIDEELYMERYYAGTFRDGSDLWYHHFLRNDAERHLHSHGFEFKTTMLCGAYTEECLNKDGKKDLRVTLPPVFDEARAFLKNIVLASVDLPKLDFRKEYMYYGNNHGRKISVFDWHRIAAVEPDTWTMIVVQPERLPYWFFKDDEGNIEQIPSSPKDWWKDYKPRV